jgi:hypoxanthine phosphoribosyltransferase
MKVLYSHEQIMEKIREVGAQIAKDYKGKNPLLVGVLKGCTIFMSHLMVNIDTELEIDFMTVSSYKHGTESGELKLVQDLDTAVQDRDVLIVEDIIDTGKTVEFLYKYFESRGVRSLEVVTFVNKKNRRTRDIPEPKYQCFECDADSFLIGFGFDCGERYRNLPGVYLMEEEDMKK